jgi:hypothetical protein
MLIFQQIQLERDFPYAIIQGTSNKSLPMWFTTLVLSLARDKHNYFKVEPFISKVLVAAA